MAFNWTNPWQRARKKARGRTPTSSPWTWKPGETPRHPGTVSYPYDPSAVHTPTPTPTPPPTPTPTPAPTPTSTPTPAPTPTSTPTPAPAPTSITDLYQDPLGQQLASLIQQLQNQLQQPITPQTDYMQLAQQFAQQLWQKPYTTQEEQTILAQAQTGVQQKYQQARQNLLNQLAQAGIPLNSPQAIQALQQLNQAEAAERAQTERGLAIQQIQEMMTRRPEALQTLLGVEQFGRGLTEEQLARMQQAIQNLYGLEQFGQSRLGEMMGYAGAPMGAAGVLSGLGGLASILQGAGGLAGQEAASILGGVGGLAGLLTQLQMQQQMLPILMGAMGQMGAGGGMSYQDMLNMMQQIFGGGGETGGTAPAGGANDFQLNVPSLADIYKQMGIDLSQYGIQ